MCRESCSEDLFRYRQCLEMELENLDIPAKATVCNDPCSCNHKEVVQSYFECCGWLSDEGKQEVHTHWKTKYCKGVGMGL